MNCTNCNASIQEDEITCEACGRNVIRSKDDLNKVDPKSTAIIGWALFGVGAFSMLFVIFNLGLLGLSGMDFVVPVGLLAIGTGTVLYARSMKK